ncbi:hypothetical protein [Deinococcus radiophilus]|uniref:hypothetical protein n=1 Tax=Deinococcus radiophilus TaxID=32062 RepID=UPI003618AD82
MGIFKCRPVVPEICVPVTLAQVNLAGKVLAGEEIDIRLALIWVESDQRHVLAVCGIVLVVAVAPVEALPGFVQAEAPSALGVLHAGLHIDSLTCDVQVVAVS